MGMGSGVPKGVKLKPIPNTNNLYSAGDDGHIYCYSSAKVNCNKPNPFLLSEFLFREAFYPHVSVIIDGKRTAKSVHTLVCRAFHGDKPTPKHVVRHLDGSKNNNLPENLAWGTVAENVADTKRHGVHAKGETQGIAKLTDAGVRIIRASIPYGLWNTRDAAAVFGVSQSTISQVARGRSWQHVK